MDKSHYRTIAVIPARGGSQRLPRKAILDFNNKPMIAHTIEAAQEAACFDKILVSSDDKEILEVSSKYGASTLTRDAGLSNAETTTAAVLIDLLNREEADGQQWDILVCLYATAPLRTASDILAVTKMIEPDVCDFAMAVCEADRPIHQALSPGSDGTLAPVWPAHINKNSNAAPKFLFGNGSTYAVSVPAFLHHRSLYGPGLKGYQMPPERSLDLNTAYDLELLHHYAKLNGQL